LAALLFVGLAVVIMAPTLPDPTSLAIGHPRADTWNHLWGYAWVGRGVLAGELPHHTSLLAWPAGGALWFIDTFGAVLTAPLVAFAGPVAAYNAYCLFSLALAGVATWALAWRETRSVPAALAAGLVFESAPHLLAQLHNGISESLAVGWMVLAVLATRVALNRPGPGPGLLAGVALAVSTVANWYYGVFALLAFGGFWVGAVVARRGSFRDLALTAATAAAGLLTLAGPVLFLFSRTMSAPDALVTRDPDFVWMTLVHHNMTDLVTFFRPGRYYSPDLRALWDEDLIVVVYLGWAVLLPAVAVLGTGQRRRASPWLGLALGFFLLTLGPFLYVGGRYLEVGDGWIPLPFLALYKGVPMFSRVSHAYRFTLGVALGLALAAAWLIGAVEQRRGVRWALALALGLGGARIAESFWASPAVFPLPVTDTTLPGIYAALGPDDGGALLDLPVSLQVLDRGRFTAYQIAHGRPIPYALNDPSPPFLYRNRFTRYLLELERSRVALLPPDGPAFEVLLGREEARLAGLRWIVVHTAEYPPTQLPKILAYLDDLATLVAERDGARLYRLDPSLP
jgi:hypothetical protein